MIKICANAINQCEKKPTNDEEIKIGFIGTAVAQQSGISLKRTKN